MKSSAHSLILVLFPLFSFIFIDFTAVSQVTQKEILPQFKSNISIDPYNILSSWDRSKDQCRDFNGVPCNSNRNVVNIVPWNTSLAGVLLPALSGLKSLRILTLRNRFTGNIPSEYRQIENTLEDQFELQCSIRNGFEGEIVDTEICNKRLEVFDGSMNRLNGEIPLSISNCNALKFLDLGFNSLNGSIPIEVVGLKRLLICRLGNNSIYGIVPVGFGSIELLEVLELLCTQVL
ncbi:putative LRR receptor-like serine/threonine-protein kinase [Camellia lanceoleosa]|uniref:LRR receptor-like serine/threonine-protein kinase n=1 Tax=Camellia lanceoleosa TaxID=1840588 RepID=A0ACC0J286_9ERIC|nr:putative LRR receptor-like serine/threonine-protein kinase [Camellia lanceoleosa]